MKMLLFALLIIAAVTTVYADTVYLRTGKVLEGKIITKTDDYIKIDIDGLIITYYLDEIDRIAESKASHSKEASLDAILGSVGSSSQIDSESAALSIAAETALTQGNYTKAIDCLEKAINLEPNNAGLYSNLGIVCLYSRKIPKAISSFEKAIQLDPEDPVAYSNLGRIYKESGKYDEAIKNLKKAIELAPDMAELYLNIGTIYNWSKQYAEAKDMLGKALTMQPTTIPAKDYSAMCYMHFGYALGGLGNFNQAKNNLLIARELFQALNDQSNLAYIDKLLLGIESNKKE